MNKFDLNEIYEIIKPLIKDRVECLRIENRDFFYNPDKYKEKAGWDYIDEISFQTKDMVYGIHLSKYYESDEEFISFGGNTKKHNAGFSCPLDSIDELIDKLNKHIPPKENEDDFIQLELF